MNNSTWKLGELNFPKPDLRAVEDINEDVVRRIQDAFDGDDVLEVIFEHNELLRKSNDLLEVSLIRQSQDTTNEKYEEERRWVYEHLPLFDKAAVEFNEAIYNSPYSEYIREKLGPMYFIKMDIEKKNYCEANIKLTQREAALKEEYQRLIATCRVEIDGEERSFLGLQRLWAHEDREVRKAAFKAFSDFMRDHEAELEGIFDELIKIRTEIGKNLGYDNYLPVAYLNRGRISYGPEDVANFRKQVQEEIVPLCSELFERQKERLGVDELMAYDETIVFPDGNAKQLGDADYMMKQIVDMFHEMSPETSEFIDFMVEHELMDCEIRPGKAAREYSTSLMSRKAPFVFTFFDGSAKSVKTLLGAMGHAFASYRAMRKQPIKEYYSSSADIMEIYVMSMTLFSNRYADRFFGDDVKKYEYYNLHDLMTFIPFGVAVDEFQHICYEHPKLTPKERSMEWRKLEEKYMPWRKYDEDDEFMARGGFWYHKQHIFLYPLYYIEYPLATINAMEMYQKYMEHPGTAWQEYLTLADLGGSKQYLETLELANITPVFKDGAVAKSIGYVKDVLINSF